MQVIFFYLFLKFKMAATDQLQFFVCEKTLKLSQKLFKFYNHIPHDMEIRCVGYFFKVFRKFIMVAMDEPIIF